MSQHMRHLMPWWVGGLLLITLPGWSAGTYHSPVAISGDAKTLFVAESSAHRIAVVDAAAGTVLRAIDLPAAPGGIALSPDGATLYVTASVPGGSVHILDVASGELRGSVAVGHTPESMVLRADGAQLFVCNRFSNDVSVIDTVSAKEINRIPVVREPSAVAVTPDGSFLVVANLLSAGASNGDFTAAAVSIVRLDGSNSGRIDVALPNGSTSIRGVCVSPDGKYVYATHILARYQLPTTQLERGWMNTNALSIIETAAMKRVNTVLLDDVDLGAANPWAVACTTDGRFLCVSHAGTHEISVIDRAALHEKLDKVAAGNRVTEVSARAEDVPNDLSFLTGLRQRIRLNGNGPRAIWMAGTTVYAAEYFSDSLSVVDVAAAGKPVVRAIALGEESAQTPERIGEMYFNDAALCFQQWQSCASCHPDARVDGLNWDLLNDGIGNPKNTKSMLLSHQTPPVMSLGSRDKAETAVRSGIKFIQFAERPESDAAAIDAYLKVLQPVASPKLVNGQLSPKAERGKELFQQAGCAVCHPAPLYTDLNAVDLGIGEGIDAGHPVDTPTLVEVWRTAPYLHDGRASSMTEVLTKFNSGDKHGSTAAFTPEEIDALAEFVLSL